MPRISLWNPVKTHDYNFVDRVVGEHIYAGGTGVHIHKYLGVHGDDDGTDATRPSPEAGSNSEVFYKIYYF